MKRTNLFIAAVSLILLTGLWSCSKNGSPTAANTDPTEAFISENYLDTPLPDGFVSSNDVTDMTMDNEMTMNPDFCPQMDAVGRPMMPPSDRPLLNPIQMGKYFRTLHWTKGQADTLRGYFKDFRDCYRQALISVRSDVQTVVQAANAQRKTIIAAVKAGTLTRQDAMAQLVALNKATLDQIKTIVAGSGICDCLHTLLNNIGALVAQDYPAQLPRWTAWVAAQKGPCFN